MKKVLLLILYSSIVSTSIYSQAVEPGETQRNELSLLIDKYSQARENRDTTLLKTILTNDVDQLVSTGEWRTGIDAAVKGMMSSSAAAPGTRTLTIEKIKMLNLDNAIVDCRYEIQNADGTTRKMWSSFIVVFNKKTWKITAIRNMLPGTL